MSLSQIVPPVNVITQHILDISGLTPDVHVLAANFLYQVCCGPHTDAPGVTWVGFGKDLVIPLPLLLISDLPEVLCAPDEWLA